LFFKSAAMVFHVADLNWNTTRVYPMQWLRSSLLATVLSVSRPEK
jgi:hypothetical protein